MVIEKNSDADALNALFTIQLKYKKLNEMQEAYTEEKGQLKQDDENE